MKVFSPALVLSSLLMLSAPSYSAELLTIMNFDSGVIPSSGGWSFGTVGGKLEISTDPNQNHAGSKGSIKGTYPVPQGGMYVWGGYDLPAKNISDIYIDFWAKMPNSKQGLKFLKVFGQKGPGTYANTTIALTSDPGIKGGITQVSFGDGNGFLENDTANVINLDGAYPDWIGRSFGKALVKTPQKKIWSPTNWGTSWHHFRVRIKFNSGTTEATQVADGAYYLEIDGVVYVDAVGIYNRHYLDLPIQRVAFFDWAQNGDSAFDIWYDDIIISTGGFYDKNPSPPIQPSLIVK